MHTYIGKQFIYIIREEPPSLKLSAVIMREIQYYEGLCNNIRWTGFYQRIHVQ